MNSFVIDRIVLARKGKDAIGNEYTNYKNGRGVCGLVVAVKGCAEYKFSDGRVGKLAGGEIGVFSSKTAYTVRNAGDTEFEHYTINFALSEKHSLPAEETYLAPASIEAFTEKCDKILEYMSIGHPASNLGAMACLYSTLCEVYSDNKVELSDRREYLSILPAISIIESSCTEKISVERLAKSCLMSCTNFRRVFKSVCGTSPAEYLIRTRISKAKALLKHTTMTISDISFSCGFKDTEHFCRTFKARCGMTAAVYRKNDMEKQ